MLQFMRRRVVFLGAMILTGIVVVSPSNTHVAVFAADQPTMESLFSDVSFQPNQATTFPDITQHWARPVMLPLVASGILQGYDGGIHPDDPITRAETVQLVSSVMGWPVEPSVSSSFPDIPTEAWYGQACQAAVANGVIYGEDDGYFHPKANVTRGEFASMIAHTFPLASTMTDATGFPDVSMDDWDGPAIAALHSAGLISGMPDGLYHPNDGMKRSEVASIIFRLLASHATDWGDGPLSSSSQEQVVQNYFRSAVAHWNDGTLPSFTLTAPIGGLEAFQVDHLAPVPASPAVPLQIQSLNTSTLFHSIGFDAIQLTAVVDARQTPSDTAMLERETAVFFLVKTGFDDPASARTAIFASTPWTVDGMTGS